MSWFNRGRNREVVVGTAKQNVVVAFDSGGGGDGGGDGARYFRVELSEPQVRPMKS